MAHSSTWSAKLFSICESSPILCKHCTTKTEGHWDIIVSSLHQHLSSCILAPMPPPLTTCAILHLTTCSLQPTPPCSSVARDLSKPLRPMHSCHITLPREWSFLWAVACGRIMQMVNCFSPSSVNVNDAHGIFLPFPHFTLRLYSVVTHHTT